MPPEKLAVAAEICNLIEFVKPNENYSVYWVEICTDGLLSNKKKTCKFTASLVDICSHIRIFEASFTNFDSCILFKNLIVIFLKK